LFLAVAWLAVSDGVSRRTVVRALGLGAVALGSAGAGCSTEATGPPDGTVHIFNGTNDERRVDIRVGAVDGDRLLAESFTVGASARVTTDRVLDTPGEYDVVASVRGSRSARTLSFPGDEEGRARGYVRVAVDRGGVLVSRAGL
jgi:hypothetical protein